jgi:hypothetical protein
MVFSHLHYVKDTDRELATWILFRTLDCVLIRKMVVFVLFIVLLILLLVCNTRIFLFWELLLPDFRDIN